MEEEPVNDDKPEDKPEDNPETNQDIKYTHPQDSKASQNQNDEMTKPITSNPNLETKTQTNQNMGQTTKSNATFKQQSKNQSKSQSKNQSKISQNNNTTKSNKDKENKKEIDHGDIFDPQIVSKRRVNINTSTAKEMYSFGKAQRFKKLQIGRETLFYNLPTVFNKKGQSAGIGIGTKSDFTKGRMKGKTDNYYDIPREFDVFRKNSPQYSFGYGRDVCKRSGTPSNTSYPGPGNYEPYKPLGYDAKKFSLFGRTWNKNWKKKIQGHDIPGPGQYPHLQINTTGKYPTSLFENSPQSSFSKSNRFNYNYSKYPPPTAYDPYPFFHNFHGNFFNSTYRSQVPKSLGDRPRDFYTSITSTTPGPGSYDIFSDLSGFSNNKKLKFDSISKLTKKSKNNEGLNRSTNNSQQ